MILQFCAFCLQLHVIDPTPVPCAFDKSVHNFPIEMVDLEFEGTYSVEDAYAASGILGKSTSNRVVAQTLGGAEVRIYNQGVFSHWALGPKGGDFNFLGRRALCSLFQGLASNVLRLIEGVSHSGREKLWYKHF